LLVSIDNATTPAVRVQNHFLGGDAAIDYVQPDGGSYLTAMQINQIVAGGGTGYDQVIEGTAAGEQLVGSTGKDLIKGLAGGDQLFGMAGNDTLQGGDGDDYLAGGNGSAAGSGDDRLEGGIGNDTLRAQDGANTLVGGAGNDSYVYGGGQDVVDNVGGGTDQIVFENGIVASQLAFSRTGDDLLITVNGNANNTVRVTGHFLGGDQAIDFVRPASGALLDTAAINALVNAGSNPGGGDDDYPSVIDGTAAAEELWGSDDRDLIRALGGNDSVYAFEGDDKIEGGDGDDQLYGGNGSFSGSGNDTLLGGAGADTLFGEDGTDQLSGGAGDDTYYFSEYSGSDVVEVGGGRDWIYMAGIARERLSFHRDVDDLIVRVDGSSDLQVRVVKHFQGGQYALALVQPGDSGPYIPASDFEDELAPMSLAGESSMRDFATDAVLAFSGSPLMSEADSFVSDAMAGFAIDSWMPKPVADAALSPWQVPANAPHLAATGRELASLVDAMSSFGNAEAVATIDPVEAVEGRDQFAHWRSWAHRGHHDGARIRHMEP
jgi:Ca2+-binding RTX toxin-like protein